MNSGRTIFAQLLDLLPLAEFRVCVDRYDGDYKVQSFSCLDQFLCLAFAQLTYRESLRDIETCLRAHRRQLYHMGFRGGISRNNLANANLQRDWRIYADFAQILIRTARELYQHEAFGVELDETVYAFDSTGPEFVQNPANSQASRFSKKARFHWPFRNRTTEFQNQMLVSNWICSTYDGTVLISGDEILAKH